MLQATAIASPVVTVASGSRYNRAGGTGLPAFSDAARLYNLGQLNLVTYRVGGNNLIADVTKLGVTPNGGVGTAIANRTDFAPLSSNIVNMQVQYGIDTGNPGGATLTSCKVPSPGTPLTATESDANITYVGMDEDKEHMLLQLRLTIQVKDRVHLAALLRNVRRVPGVNRILRERG